MTVMNRNGLKSWGMGKSGLEVKRKSRVKRKERSMPQRMDKKIC